MLPVLYFGAASADSRLTIWISIVGMVLLYDRNGSMEFDCSAFSGVP